MNAPSLGISEISVVSRDQVTSDYYCAIDVRDASLMVNSVNA
jgi:hypothetical protein